MMSTLTGQALFACNREAPRPRKRATGDPSRNEGVAAICSLRRTSVAAERRRDVAEGVSVGRPSGSLRRILVPLALAQFICSFAGSNMNVMINDISKDLDTTVQGVQTAITVFLLVMAALMIPGGKLTDRWGRKRCFTVGLIVYGIGALMSAVVSGPRRVDPRQLDPRRCRHRAADPAGLHPHDAALQRRHVAGAGVRGDQRAWAASAPRRDR